ncbi:MAG: NAD(P)-dependent oxidoreductase [Nannocystaceae bacterium]
MLQPKLGFVGLGTMGSGMVSNLLAAGYVVTGTNRSPGRGRSLRERGMLWAEGPADAARGADIVLVCVSDDEAVRDVLLGENGVISAVGDGTLVVDAGTTSLALTHELADRLKALGARFVAAPMTGSKLGAKNGTLTFMVGGDPADVARLEPVLEAMGRHVVHVGTDVGAGQAAKYCLNMSQAVVLQGIVEGYTLAKKLGVSLERMSEVFENSAGRTGVGVFKTPYLFRGDDSPHFRLRLMHKDLHLALGLASDLRVPLPAASAVRLLYDQGVAEGLGDRDFLALARLMERWAKVELSLPPAPTAD